MWRTLRNTMEIEDFIMDTSKNLQKALIRSHAFIMIRIMLVLLLINHGSHLRSAETIRWDCVGQLKGDADRDGQITLFDFAFLARSWLADLGDSTYECIADFNRNGSIDLIDLNTFTNNWLKSPNNICPIFVIEAQCAVRNCPCTACAEMVDSQDGAYVNLASTVGGFMWRVQILPYVMGRNGLAPDWTLYTNSRAYSRDGWFGTTPANLTCFERVWRRCDGKLIYQDKQIRHFIFDLQPIPGTPPDGDSKSPVGATAQARYEVLHEIPTEITIRRPDGVRFTFFPLDEAPTAGALKTIENRFGDVITHRYNSLGQLETVTDVYGRQWTFTYDSQGRLKQTQEDENTLKGRFVKFFYDDHNRLERIDTTPVVTDGGIGNQFPNGKSFMLGYPAVNGDLAHDTNITSVIYPNEVLDGSHTPRIQNTYYPDDRLENQVWGGANSAGVAGGGTLSYMYGLNTTTVTDRNGNKTIYTFNNQDLAIRMEEFSNRNIRAGIDPTSYLTEFSYNQDEELTEIIHPLGNRMQYTYDTTNPNRYAHGNLLEMREIADATRGGDGTGSLVNDIVQTFRYEPIFQQTRIDTSARGYDPNYIPPIADNEANVQDIDFNLDGDTNDPGDGEALPTRRYSEVTFFDYQEDSTAQILALATQEGITLTPTQAAALSLATDLNQDGLTTQQFGRPVEVHQPAVTLTDGTAQAIIDNYRWNAFGLLKEEIDPEGYVTQYMYSPAGVPNAQGGTGLNEGGYLFQIIDDATTPQIRMPDVLPPDPTPIASVTTTIRDKVGNIVASIDPRGIKDIYVVNELDQVQISRQAADTGSLNPEEPRSLIALDYEIRSYFDGNNNVVLTETENVVDQGGGNHQQVTGNPFFETSFTYDILDNLIEMTQEVASGESRTIRSMDFPVGPTETLTTRYRYDRNENQVVTLSPLAVIGSEPNNVISQIYDERDLLWKTTRGGIDNQFLALTAHADISLTFGNTPLTSTTRRIVDDNGNMQISIDAEDHGTPHNGSNGLMDTDDLTLAGIQRGDPTITVYDGFDRVAETRDAMDYRTQFTYNPDSHVIAIRRMGPAGGNQRGGGAADRLLTSRCSFYDEISRSYRTEVDYFRSPQPLASPVIEDVYVSEILFDADSSVVRQKRPLEDFREMVYDGKDRVVVRKSNSLTGSGPTARTVVPHEIHYHYDDNDNLIQTKEIERSVERNYEEVFFQDFFYDAANRKELSISNHFSDTFEANATRKEYDSLNNVVASINANSSFHQSFTLERDGSVIVQINSGGNAVISVHDGLGRVVMTARELRQDHDGNNPLDTSNPHNNDGLIITHQNWDKNSRLISESDDPDTSQLPGPLNPSTTVYVYDHLNRLVQQINADGEDPNWIYDRDDIQTIYTDENGSIFLHQFDDLHRLTMLDIVRAVGVLGTTQQTIEYDGLSRKTRLTDNNGIPLDASLYLSVVTCSYDSLSRKTEEIQENGDLGAKSINIEFDRNSNPIQLTYPGQIGGGGRRLVTFGYGHAACACQTLNRIQVVEDGAGSGTGNDIVPGGAPENLIARYEYIGPRRIETRTYGNGFDGNGVKLTKSYDALRRVLQMEHSHANLGGMFAGFAYAFDKANNLLKEEFLHEGKQDIYQYDSMNRLICEARGANLGGIVNNQAENPPFSGEDDLRNWELDGANNWIEVQQTGLSPSLVSLVPNEMNEYDAVNGQFYSYDANGNLIQDPNNNYSYDAFNRLVRVQDRSDSKIIAHYNYDAKGRRVRRNVNTGTSGLSANANTEIAENFIYYYHGNRVIEEEDQNGTTLRQYVWGQDGLLQYVDSYTMFSYLPFNVHENGLGSIVLTTPQGAEFLANQRDYNAYGKFDELGDELTTILPYTFQGWRTDPETGFYGFGNGIYFNPVLGRSINRGPGSLLNLYACGSNNLFRLGGLLFCCPGGDNGDDPRDVPPPTIYGEEIESNGIGIQFRFYIRKLIKYKKEKAKEWAKRKFLGWKKLEKSGRVVQDRSATKKAVGAIWEAEIWWWAMNINDNCDDKPRIDFVQHLGVDASLPPDKPYYASGNAKIKKYREKKYLIGRSKLSRLIEKDKENRSFHIGFFKKVKYKPQSKSGSGFVPGIIYDHHFGAVKDNNTTVYDRRHEIGHYFGLDDGDGGLMSKRYKKRSKGSYGDKRGGPNDFLKSWCSKIASHLGG